MLQNAPDPIQKKGENGKWRSEKEGDIEGGERERGLVRAGKRKAVCQGASKPVKKVLEKPVTFWPAWKASLQRKGKRGKSEGPSLAVLLLFRFWVDRSISAAKETPVTRRSVHDVSLTIHLYAGKWGSLLLWWIVSLPLSPRFYIYG